MGNKGAHFLKETGETKYLPLFSVVQNIEFFTPLWREFILKGSLDETLVVMDGWSVCSPSLSLLY